MRRFLVGAIAFAMALTMPGMAGESGVPVMAHEEQLVSIDEDATIVTDSTGTYYYKVNEDQTATITKYLDTTADVELVIPSEIDGYTVSAIGEKAFYFNRTIISLVIPGTIKTIGVSAFESCANIAHVTLNDGLVSIGDNAFKCCKNIATLNVPASVTYIGEGAFSTEYGVVTTITLTPGNANYKITNNILFTSDEKLLLHYWGNEDSFVVPDTVEKIGGYAFWGNNNLINVTIGSNVKTIGEGAFGYNSKLTNVIIPNNVVKIERYAFQGCKAINTLKIGKGVTEIYACAFNGANIDEVVIPSNVKELGACCFLNAGIEKITIEEGLEKIEDGVFSNNKFETITFPASAKTIEEEVVSQCVNLKEIKVATGNQNYKIVDTALVTMDGKTILGYPIGNGVERYQIPYGVTKIGRETFANCKLKRIEMPKTLKNMEAYAFENCDTLEEVVIGGSVTGISEAAFSYCTNLKSVYIPSSVTKILWGAFWYCDSLENIYYVGSKEQWNQIELFMDQNEPLEKVTIHYMSNLRMFVERMYWDALGRAYDNYGLNSWVQMLVAGTHDGAGLAKEFVLGDEFAMRNLSDEEYVDVLYETFFDRGADETGRMLWIGELASGKSRAYVLSKFVNLPEFTRLCGEYDILRGVMFEDGNVATPGCVQFVGRLYDLVMGRDADNDGLYTWTFALTNGLANAQGVATQFFNGAEYTAKNTSNETYVTDLYGVFMDRTPDESGLAFWVSCLSEQGVSRDWVLSEFAKSEEFKMIAARYGIQ